MALPRIVLSSILLPLAVTFACGQAESTQVGFVVRSVHAPKADAPTRRIAVLTWHPTSKATGRSVRLTDYVASETLSFNAGSLDSAHARFLSTISAILPSDAPESVGDSLLSSRRHGVRTDATTHRRLPTVILATGFNAPAYTNAAFAELLAERGMLVVAVPTGSHAGKAMALDSAGVHSAIDDLRMVRDAVLAWPEVDTTRLAYVAWSVGGIATALLAEESPRAQALVSLDAATGYAYGDTLLSELAPPRWNSTVPYLHIDGDIATRVAKSTTFLASRCSRENTFTTVRGLAHRHFTSIWGRWSVDSLGHGLDTATLDGIHAWESLAAAWLAEHLGLLDRANTGRPSNLLVVHPPGHCPDTLQ